MAENQNKMRPERDDALQGLAREWLPLMGSGRRAISDEELQKMRDLQNKFYAMPESERDRLKNIIEQMRLQKEQDAKPMFLGGPKGDSEEAPQGGGLHQKIRSVLQTIADAMGKTTAQETQPEPDAMRAGLGRFAVSPAKLKDVADAVAAAPGAIGNAATDLYGRIKRWETDPTLPSSRGDTDIGKDAFELGPGMIGTPGGGSTLLAAGRGTLVSKILNQPEIQTAIKVMKQSGKTDAEIAAALNNHFRLEDETISSRAVTGNRQRAGIPSVRGDERTAWTPEMVDSLRSLTDRFGSDRRSIVEGFRDQFPDYTGTDRTLHGQLSKLKNTGGVNTDTGAASVAALAGTPGPATGKLTPEMQQTIADLAGKSNMRLKDKIDAFRATHNFEGSNGTIVRRLKEAEAESEEGDFTLGAMGGSGRGGRIMPEDVQSIADKLGADVRLTKDTDKNGTVYMSVKSAENPGDARWDTVVRVPTDNKSHAGRRIPGSSQYVIDTTDANPKRIDPNIATNMGGGRYSDIDNLEAALRARSGDKSIPPEQRPAPQQLTLGGRRIFPNERVEPRVGEPKPGEPPPDPNQLKLLSGGVPIGPFETTVEQEPGTSSFAKSSDIRQSQDELLASSARHLADQSSAHNAAIDDLLSYPRLRFGLPAGFVLDKPNAMRPE